LLTPGLKLFALSLALSQFTCASARIHLTNNPNDVWICSTDGQMGQVCIMNTFPDLTVSSCNTVCNSRITCIQCVPPFRRPASTKSNKPPTTQFMQQLSRRLEPETQRSGHTGRSRDHRHEKPFPRYTNNNHHASDCGRLGSYQ